MKTMLVVSVLALLLVSILFRQAIEKPLSYTVMIRNIQVAVWLPPDSAPRPWPVVIFSHSLLGCNTAATFLTQALAQAGYAVFAPNHKDRSCAIEGKPDPIRKSLYAPETWNANDYADRMEDVRTLLTELSKRTLFSSARFDWKHVGFAGTSLGGYTGLALAGAWPDQRDTRISAVLAMVPYSGPMVSHGALNEVRIPVMYQVASEDVLIEPENQAEAYRLTGGEAWFVELNNATHTTWQDVGDSLRFQPFITDYAIAFFDTALKGRPFPEILQHRTADILEFQHKLATPHLPNY